MNQVNIAPLSSTVKAKGRRNTTTGPTTPAPAVDVPNPAQASETPTAGPTEGVPGTPEGGATGSNGGSTTDGKVPKHLKARVYMVKTRDGKRREYVKANSRAKAILYMAMSDWSANAASGEELFEAGKSGAEIYDATGLADGE